MLNIKLPIRYNFTQFPFHNNPQKCITFLVRMGPDNLLAYFTMFWELTITFV